VAAQSPFDRYGQKAVLEFRSKPLFAELVILRLFEEVGWSGVWVDSYRKRFRADVTEPVEIPADNRHHTCLADTVRAVGGLIPDCRVPQ
jgi:hypothetical protein